MSILQDMDAVFVASAPLPQGSAWLIGGNVWHALMADLNRIHRDQGVGDLFDAANPPTTLYGAPYRRIGRMSGWGLAQALDAAEELEHGDGLEEVDAHEKSVAE